MPICAPCRVPHQAGDCEDTQAGRTGLARGCYCQPQAARRGPRRANARAGV